MFLSFVRKSILVTLFFALMFVWCSWAAKHWFLCNWYCCGFWLIIHDLMVCALESSSVYVIVCVCVWVFFYLSSSLFFFFLLSLLWCSSFLDFSHIVDRLTSSKENRWISMFIVCMVRLFYMYTFICIANAYVHDLKFSFLFFFNYINRMKTNSFGSIPKHQ